MHEAEIAGHGGQARVQPDVMAVQRYKTEGRVQVHLGDQAHDREHGIGNGD